MSRIQRFDTCLIVKMDRRFKGHNQYTHRVQFSQRGPERFERFIRVRNDLWDSFGPSSEWWSATPTWFGGQQPQWAWDCSGPYIYLRDKALVMFVMKWAGRSAND